MIRQAQHSVADHRQDARQGDFEIAHAFQFAAAFRFSRAQLKPVLNAHRAPALSTPPPGSAHSKVDAPFFLDSLMPASLKPLSAIFVQISSDHVRARSPWRAIRLKNYLAWRPLRCAFREPTASAAARLDGFGIVCHLPAVHTDVVLASQHSLADFRRTGRVRGGRRLFPARLGSGEAIQRPPRPNRRCVCR